LTRNVSKCASSNRQSGEAFGIADGEKPERIRLLFSAQVAAYIRKHATIRWRCGSKPPGTRNSSAGCSRGWRMSKCWDREVCATACARSSARQWSQLPANNRDALGKQPGQQVGVHTRTKFAGPLTGSLPRIDDWLYRMDDKTVLNRSELSKFGLKVCELVITFRKK